MARWALVGAFMLNAISASAWAGNACQNLGLGNNPGAIHTALKAALNSAVLAEVSGLDLNMWGTLVARDGTVCAVARSGKLGDQWPGSRVISAQKANTANAFSLPANTANGQNYQQGLALSTANLYSAVQPGGAFFGLQHSNPVDPEVAYKGPSSNWGEANDAMVGKQIGGVNVFGGGLALYNASHQVVGAVGVSGDSSCADHMVAWRTRNNLGLDHLAGVGGVSGDSARPDNIIYDIPHNPNGGTGISNGGFGHPTCIVTVDPTGLPAVQ
ncbi:MAG: heme-binding protein [Methyloglobulus sp.]|nr:heme-binding protein [Methyloglobulus sp.]